MMYAEGRVDLENLLYRNKEEKFIKKHGQFCPPDEYGRKRD